MEETDPLEVAARALRHRDRSRRELDERLGKAGIGEDARADALETLERVGYLDDARFAVSRAQALADRGYGDAYISHDLESHGVGSDELAAALAAIEPEPERATRLVARLGRTVKTAAQLARKGFAEESLESALGAEIAVTEDDQ